MSSQHIWKLPSTPLSLTANDVHVWQIALDQSEENVAHFQTTLSADERARADRFHFDRDRRRYSVARGGLRSILGRYLDCAPHQLAFAYGPQGKPYLLLASNQIPLHFNLAHSQELALCAITLVSEVGVDVEYTRRQVTDFDKIAARFFSADENAVYRTLPAQGRRAAFFRCWTRKEAFIKAVGEGLSYPLDRFVVSLAPNQPAAILSIDGSAVEDSAWTLFHVEPAVDYVGAVVVHGSRPQLSGWMYQRDVG
jgi:4'-phosphopantetheinyl transferase